MLVGYTSGILTSRTRSPAGENSVIEPMVSVATAMLPLAITAKLSKCVAREPRDHTATVCGRNGSAPAAPSAPPRRRPTTAPLRCPPQRASCHPERARSHLHGPGLRSIREYDKWCAFSTARPVVADQREDVQQHAGGGGSRRWPMTDWVYDGASPGVRPSPPWRKCEQRHGGPMRPDSIVSGSPMRWPSTPLWRSPARAPMHRTSQSWGPRWCRCTGGIPLTWRSRP